MEKIKYAIIGFGGIAENRIAKEGYGCDKARFNGIEHGVLIGATDMNQARSTAAAALGLKWYKSIDELLADKEVEAVYIATNNASHAQIAIQCLNAGKHVIVEKPVATTIEDAQAKIDEELEWAQRNPDAKNLWFQGKEHAQHLPDEVIDSITIVRPVEYIKLEELIHGDFGTYQELKERNVSDGGQGKQKSDIKR